MVPCTCSEHTVHGPGHHPSVVASDDSHHTNVEPLHPFQSYKYLMVQCGGEIDRGSCDNDKHHPIQLRTCCTPSKPTCWQRSSQLSSRTLPCGLCCCESVGGIELDESLGDLRSSCSAGTSSLESSPVSHNLWHISTYCLQPLNH